MEVEIIKADNVFDDNALVKKNKRLRVAAYCRVSTDDEDQIKSYDSMIRHYTDLINNSPEWIMAGVYADKAITGTKVDKREEFQRLISDCMDGKIDMVIAKSIPRFARNTLDTLKYVRLLKEKGIAVYFEVEKINTVKNGEFLLTILSSVAQQEVENTSAYVKKGLKMKMSRGELVGFQGCLGYDYDVNTKTIHVNEKEAETVRYIFDRYVAGAGGTIIARELNAQGIKTIRGNKWTVSGVMGIIKNEKYTGDLMLGKTFTTDPISKRRLDNRGEEDRYFIKNHHEAIIDYETYIKAQDIRKKRGGNRGDIAPMPIGSRAKFSRQYAFSCMIDCGFCGCTVSRRNWHSNTNHTKTIWQCSNATKNGKRACPHCKGITEDVIESAFVESYKIIKKDNSGVLKDFMKKVEDSVKKEDIEKSIKSVHRRIYKLRRDRKDLLSKYLKDGVDRELYQELDNDFKMKLASEESRLESLAMKSNEQEEQRVRIESLRRELSKTELLEEFDRAAFESVVEKVILGGYDEDGNVDPYKITFIYKMGTTDGIDHAKEKFEKPYKKPGPKRKDAFTFNGNEAKDACIVTSDNTCGNRLLA